MSVRGQGRTGALHAARPGAGFLFVSLNYQRYTPRGFSELVGAYYDLEQAYLAVALKSARIPAHQFIMKEPATLPALARSVSRRRAEAVVLRYEPELSRTTGELAAQIKDASPDTRILYSGVPTSALVKVLQETPATDACLGPDAEGYLVNLARQLLADEDPVPQPRTAVMLDSGELLPPAKGDSSPANLSSPYLEEYLPPAVGPVVGVELLRESAPDLRSNTLRHPVERVAKELRWLGERLPETTTVELRGKITEEDTPLLELLCEQLGAAAPNNARPWLQVDSAILDERRVQMLSKAGFGGFTYHVDATGSSGEASIREEIIDALYELTGTAERLGLETQAHISFASSYENPVLIEDLVSEIAALCPEFTYEWPSGKPGAREPHEVLYAPELLSSRTFLKAREADQLAFFRLQRLLSGLYPENTGYVEATSEMLWQDPDDPARSQGWLVQTLGLNSALYVERDRGYDGRAPAPLGEIHSIREASSELGKRFLDREQEFSVLNYCTGRERLPDAPLVLQADTEEDIQQFLDDADRAREHGTFVRAISHPLVTLKDLCRWGGPGQCATPRLARLAVDQDGTIRSTPGGPALGSLGDTFDGLLARVRRKADDLHAARDCKECPVLRMCSQCQCLPEWVGMTEYCEWRRERPWLALYASVPVAVGRLATIHPELAASGDESGLSVSGFCGTLYYNGPVTAASLTSRLLLRVSDQHYLFDIQSRRLIRVGADLAAIYEGLAYAPKESDVAKWLAESRDLTLAEAERTLGVVREQLKRVGVSRAAQQVRTGDPPYA